MLQRYLEIIDELLERNMTQDKLDDIDSRYVTEMSKFLKALSNTLASKKATRHSIKGYWNENLTLLWKTYHEAEKAFVKTPKNTHGYIAIRDRFHYDQKAFDKEIKRSKRSYEHTKVFNIEVANTENPTEFW